MKTPTVHNPTNFEPSDYEVAEYLDNRSPEFPAFAGATMSREEREAQIRWFQKERQMWLEEWQRYFPGDDQGQKRGPQYRCAHCGERNVRYMVAVLHKPTGKHVAFGDICVARLGFPNHQAFRAEKIRSHAANEAKRLKRIKAMADFIEKTPEFATAYAVYVNARPTPATEEQTTLGESADSYSAKSRWKIEFPAFVHDIVGKFSQYGSLSEKQVGAVARAITQSASRAEERAAEAQNAAPVPTGRVDVEGVILTTKVQDGYMGRGTTLKMLVRHDAGWKVWLTMPTSLCADKGDRVAFSCEIEASADDKTFGFGKRPTKARNLTRPPSPDTQPF